MVCGFLFFNIIFRVLVVRHWWAFAACDVLQLYAISELLLIDRTKSGHKADYYATIIGSAFRIPKWIDQTFTTFKFVKTQFSVSIVWNQTPTPKNVPCHFRVWLRGTYKNAKYIMVCGFLFCNVIFRVLVVRYWWAFGAVVCDLRVVTDGSHATARSQATKSLRASSSNSHQVWRNSTGLISYKGNYVCCVCKKRLWSWSI